MVLDLVTAAVAATFPLSLVPSPISPVAVYFALPAPRQPLPRLLLASAFFVVFPGLCFCSAFKVFVFLNFFAEQEQAFACPAGF